MSDSGDLTWKVPRGAVAEPYFAQSFDLYEVKVYSIIDYLVHKVVKCMLPTIDRRV